MSDEVRKDWHSESGRHSEPRTAYTKPALTKYGQVRFLTKGGSAGTGDGNSTQQPAVGMSDRATKEGVHQIGTHPLGVGLYLFNYKPQFRERWGTGRQFGVMADEVEQVMPEAVSVGPDGYKRVDYAMLGIHRHLQ